MSSPARPKRKRERLPTKTELMAVLDTMEQQLLELMAHKDLPSICKAHVLRIHEPLLAMLIRCRLRE